MVLHRALKRLRLQAGRVASLISLLARATKILKVFTLLVFLLPRSRISVYLIPSCFPPFLPHRCVLIPILVVTNSHLRLFPRPLSLRLCIVMLGLITYPNIPIEPL